MLLILNHIVDLFKIPFELYDDALFHSLQIFLHFTQFVRSFLQFLFEIVDLVFHSLQYAVRPGNINSVRQHAIVLLLDAVCLTLRSACRIGCVLLKLETLL